MNPEVWVTSGTQPGGTYTIEDGGRVDMNTGECCIVLYFRFLLPFLLALAPFWRTQRLHWTSADVRDWAGALHYSYPEFDGLEGASPTRIREAIVEIVDRLYGPTLSQPWQQEDDRYPVIPSLDSVSSYSSQTTSATSAVPSTVDGSVEPPAPDAHSLRSSMSINGYNSTRHEWTIHIRFNKFELGRSYAILVYLGEMYVGAVSAFTSSAAQKCARCRNNWDVELEGFIHLDEAISINNVPTHSPHMVKPFLAEQLHIEVMGRKVRSLLG